MINSLVLLQILVNVLWNHFWRPHYQRLLWLFLHQAKILKVDEAILGENQLDQLDFDGDKFKNETSPLSDLCLYLILGLFSFFTLRFICYLQDIMCFAIIRVFT